MLVLVLLLILADLSSCRVDRYGLECSSALVPTRVSVVRTPTLAYSGVWLLYFPLAMVAVPCGVLLEPACRLERVKYRVVTPHIASGPWFPLLGGAGSGSYVSSFVLS